MSGVLKVSRLECLTDGIFAIAMTILILDLRLPAGISSTSLGPILTSTVLFKLFIYICSFIILGTLWIAINFQEGLIERLNRPYLWANVFLLMGVCVIPFSASLVASFPKNPASVTFYVFNLLWTSAGQILTVECAYYFKLNNSSFSDAMRYAAIKRVFVAPVFYLIALLLVYRYPAIAFLMLVIPTITYIIPGRIDKFNKIK